MKSTRSTRFRVAVLILMSLAAIVVSFTFVLRHEEALATNKLVEEKRSLDHDIQKTLPAGTERSDVEHFLAERNVDHTLYTNLSGADSQLYNGSTSIIDGYTGEMRVPFFHCKLHLTFEFDKNAKLLHYLDRFACNDSIL